MSKIDIVEIVNPGHGVAPVAIKIKSLADQSDLFECSPPVHPHYDWPYNYFGPITCCGKIPDAQRRAIPHYALEIIPQYSNRGYLTIVCEHWLITHFPEFFILNTMKHTGNLEYCSVRLEFIPCLDEDDLHGGESGRPSCHQCSTRSAKFDLFSRQRTGYAPQPLKHFGVKQSPSPRAQYRALWEKGNSKWSQGHRWCLRCIYAHSELFNLFDASQLKILKRLWPKARYVKRAKPDTSRHYATNAYGPIALSEFELSIHRKKPDASTQFLAYIKKTYGADNPWDIFGGLKDPVARTSFGRER